MFTASRRPLILVTALVACTVAAVCSKSTSHVDGEVQQSAVLTPRPAECARADFRPSAIPPEAGMWSDIESPDSAGVVAMIGPAEVRAGSTAITRTIETIEGAGGARPTRTRVDTGVMRLELLPRYVASGRTTSTEHATEPAAAYALSSLITVASYEACVDFNPFVVRYLRRDTKGGIARDAMLRRVSGTR